MAWIGSILLAVCAFPQVVVTVRDGKCDQLSLSFLLLWLAGEVLLVFHSINIHDVALYFNYTVNASLVLILLKYKVRPRVSSR